ncbi:beta strand repeat-containing protein [Poritiphilus flavus]|uniref:Sodium:calcium exchanger n=1 Tax=Poritiphilus flavus TaxID=2697053 RepID=A0A6L9EB62_9FLAO|nr:Calx-beta domain-containing protein [Poritiphilus flavus]NAS11822.1 sodium:calcium exchanger [Poritiphilus flavus]
MLQIMLKKFGSVILYLLLTTVCFGQQTYLDTFSSVSYSQNNGTANFASNWTENNETTDPSGGRIRITSNQLRFNNLDGRWIYRDLDLTGATSVTLSLDYDATSRGNEGLYIYLWNNSTSNYDVIATINSTNTGTVNYNLTTNYISANSRIAIGGIDSNWSNGEIVFIDNVLFTATFGATITIADVTVDEGAGTATFTATHTGANTTGPFTVNFQTVNGTATAGSDYTSNTGTLNFNGTSGDTEQITVSITDDTDIESSETFTIQFTGTSDGSVTITDTATGTITDNDSTIITDGTTTTTCSTVFFDSGGSGGNYGNSEDRTHTFCPATPGTQIRLNFTSFDVENGFDFLYVYEGTTTGGTLIGQYHNGNLPPSTITSSDASGCLTFRFTSDGSVTDPGWEIAVSCYTPAPALTIDDVAVDEDAGTATFTVTHTGVSTSGPFTVNFTTADGTATAGLDYTLTSGTLSFNGTVGDTEQIVVPITDDMIVEGDETFTISFNTVSDTSVDITDTATGTINNNIGVDTPLTLFNEFNGYYDYAVTGGSLRDQDNNTNSCSITTSSSNTLTSTVPATATIERAYLFWVHSGATPDLDVTFEGQNVTAAYADQTSFGSNVFYAMIGDVTTLVSGVTNLSTNTFDFTGLTIDNADPYCSSTVVVGGWTLMVFYSDDSLPAVSINLYQGFDGEQNNTQSFTLSGFYAIGASGAKTTVLSWEGDQTLANNELLSLTTTSGTTTLSGDGDNDGSSTNNPFNSTIFDNTVVPNVNNTTTYGLDLDTYDISALISQGESSATTNVQVGQDYVMLNAVILKVPSNIIVGSVFEDVNYGGGAGRDMATSSGVGVENARVELYDSTGTFEEFTTTDATGAYAFGGMANGDYSVRVVSNTVRSSRGGGAACTTCLPILTYRRNYTTLGGFVNITNEVGGADPTATDVGAGVLTNAQNVSTVTITADGVAGFDFGFNFNTIVNTNEDGQGSLEQFIINSNNLDETGLDIETNSIFNPASGEDTSVFMIPPTGDTLGRTADANFASGYFDITITNGNPLTNITDSNTVIDGRTQTAYSGDTNSGSVGSGGTTVGVSANTLPNYDRPEIQLYRNNGDVLINEGSSVTIRNIAVYAAVNAGIRVDNGSATISNNLLGVNALGVNAGNIEHGVEVIGGAATIDGNFISTNIDTGVRVDGGTSTIIQNNHITANGNGACDDNITIVSGSGVVIQRNLIENAASLAIDGDGIAGSVTISENTIATSGQNGGNCSGNVENAGILLDGNNSSISNNIIRSNGGPGIVLAGGNSSGNLISQNSIYANGTASDALGIDLDNTDAIGDGVTLNDSGDSDTGPNGSLNFPIISGAYMSGSNLVISGWARPGATIEFFLTDIQQGTASAGDNELGLSTDYGEGQTYLASGVEGSVADTNSGTSVYTDADGNTDNTNQFEFSIPVASPITLGNHITATATLSNSTSEFSPFSIIKIRTIITNRRITYRVNPN